MLGYSKDLKSFALDSGNDCICKPGSWRPDGQRGAACIECPPGTVCAGKLSVHDRALTASPYPDRTAEIIVWGQSTTVNGSLAVLGGYPWMFRGGRIIGRDGKERWEMPGGQELKYDKLFFDCHPGACVGGVHFDCSKGHGGRKCMNLLIDGWMEVSGLID